jgi:hypothetical protein
MMEINGKEDRSSRKNGTHSVPQCGARDLGKLTWQLIKGRQKKGRVRDAASSTGRSAKPDKIVLRHFNMTANG